MTGDSSRSPAAARSAALRPSHGVPASDCPPTPPTCSGHPLPRLGMRLPSAVCVSAGVSWAAGLLPLTLCSPLWAGLADRPQSLSRLASSQQKYTLLVPLHMMPLLNVVACVSPP